MRFPEFNDPWTQTINKEIFIVVNERNYDLSLDNVVSASLNRGVVPREELGIDIKYDKESIRGYKIVQDGDYIIHLRSFQGGFAFSRIEGICSPAYTILHPQTSKLYYSFLEKFYTSNKFINSLKLVTYGIRDGKSISVEEWLREKTSLPSLTEQKKIVDFLSLIDERIKVEEELLQQYESQKRYLLKKMFV